MAEVSDLSPGKRKSVVWREADEALRQSREWLARIVELVPDGILILNSEGRFVFANAATERILGVPRAEMTRRFYSDPPYQVLTASGQALPAEQRPFAQVMSSGQAVQGVELAIERPDKSRVLLAVSAAPIHDATGRVVHVVQSLSDITARKRAEQSLRQSEEWLRNVMRHARCILWSGVVAGRPGWEESLDPGAGVAGRQERFDWPDQLLDEQAAHEILPLDVPPGQTYSQAWLASRDPGDHAAMQVTAARALISGASHYAQEFRCTDRHGRIHWLREEVSLRALERGQWRVYGVVTDVTERRQAEDARRESEERYRLLADVCPDAIFINRGNKIVFVNNACVKLFGASRPEQILGRSPFDFTHPDDHALVRERIRRQLELGEAVALTEERIYRLDGTLIVVEVAAAPILEQGMRAIQAVLRDVTERKRAEEERRRLETEIQHSQRLESLGVLAGGIAHDFNNLLVGILGNADLALLDLAPQSAAHKRIEDIKTAGVRASELTRQMLAYSGKGRFVVELLDVNQLIEEMAHLLSVSISKGVVLRYNLAAGLPMMEGDASQIRQVVMNLITNASDAIGNKSGIITLTTGVVQASRQYLSSVFLNKDLPEGYYVYIEVSDTGCGMDEQTKPRIFDPFFSTKFAGRGLGLAAVLGIVRGHRGAVKVYSEPGKGTALKLLFPSSGKQAEAAKGPAETPLEELRGTGLILVVDDEESVRNVVKMSLERFGYQVLSAPDGLDALRLFRENSDRIVLVLLDMTMPHLSGEETFRELRQIQPAVRVILTSGYNEQEATTHFVGKGLAGFLQKPFRMEALVEKVAHVCRRP